jgi:uncharacterized membrane protein YphA (DoxX/SURF4 family)
MRKNLPMILVRLMVGIVFLFEGILKFVRPGELGAGRFEHIGLPLSGLLAPLVAVVEIVSGAALVLGVYAGDAALMLFLVIMAAIITTKIPILLGHSLWRFPAAPLSHYGFLSFIHEARTDLCMLLGTAAILIDSGIKLGRRTQWYQR